MPLIAHVHRRGAVYYWRRRLPVSLDKKQHTHVALSLRTTNQAFARATAARLDQEFSHMFERKDGSVGGDHRLTPDQIKTMLVDVALKHHAKLERVKAYDQLMPSFDVEDSRTTDRVMGSVFRLLASGGPNVRMDSVTIARLEEAGLSNAEIDRVAASLVMLRDVNGHVDPRRRLEQLLESVGAPPTPVNLQLAQTTKYRAMAAALLNTKDRWDFSIGNDEISFDAILREEAGRLPVRLTQAKDSADMPCERSPIAQQAQPEIGSKVEAEAAIATDKSDGPSGDIVENAEALLKGAMLNVDDKTKRQVRSAAALLGRYLKEVHGVTDLRNLKQGHVAGFAGFLQTEIYVHHGKSVHDEKRSIAELRVIWAKKSKDLIGLDKATMERCSGQINQVLAAARARGVPVDRDLTWKGLIANKSRKGRARDARPTMSISQSESLYRQAPFTGCKAWNRLEEPGDLVFHCALYFVPMLVDYGGGRREELCGALAKDVITDNGSIPYIWIVDNEFRRIKNAQSVRPIVVHPELIRLGFLNYVRLLIDLGYKLLFPDLYSPTSRSPMGDRLGDQLRPVLNAAGVTARGTGVHSSRRGFGNNLKQEDVAYEKRADLLGHGGNSETTERYCEHYKLEILLKEIMKLPIFTGHLEPKPMQLLPWVAAKERPPFSHPSRTKPSRGQSEESR